MGNPVDEAWEKYELCHDALDSAVDNSKSDRDDTKIIRLIDELDAAQKSVDNAIREQERSRYDGLLYALTAQAQSALFNIKDGGRIESVTVSGKAWMNVCAHLSAITALHAIEYRAEEDGQ